MVGAFPWRALSLSVLPPVAPKMMVESTPLTSTPSARTPHGSSKRWVVVLLRRALPLSVLRKSYELNFNVSFSSSLKEDGSYANTVYRCIDKR